MCACVHTYLITRRYKLQATSYKLRGINRRGGGIGGVGSGEGI